MEALQFVKDANFEYWPEMVHLYLGGSNLHGAKLEGKHDLDIYGVFVEPPNRALGIHPCGHFVHSTGGQERRNTPEDVDIAIYGLRRWAALAAKGNPTILNSLFAPNLLHSPPERDTWFHGVWKFRECFLARSHYKGFLGFADAQMGRLLGTRGNGKHGQRPELAEQHGYDTKAGMHAIRLLHECLELLATGNMTFPRPEKDLLIEIRSGAWSIDKLSNEANILFAACKDAVEKSPLRATVNQAEVSDIIANAYMMHWRKWRY